MTCGGLNERGLQRLRYVNVMSLADGTILRMTGRCGLVVGILSLGLGLEASKPQPHLVIFLSLPAAYKSDVSSHLLLQFNACQLLPCFLT